VTRKIVLSRRAILGAVVPGAALAACTATPDRPDSQVPPRRALEKQVSVVSPPPKSAVLTAFDVQVSGRDALSELFRVMSGAAAGAEVSLAVGASLFDDRFGLRRLVPRRLSRMPSFPNDALDPARCDGDLLLQVCAVDTQGAREATRRVQEAGGARLRPRWTIEGFRDENSVTSDGRPSTRDLFGFREGVGNPDVRDADLMDKLVWVQPDSDEPAWAAGGTYQVVRLIRFAPTLWDAEPLTRQEAVIGRRKTDGSPLGRTGEASTFDYVTDQTGQTIALDAHIRRANPRTPATEENRILRRGYSYRRDEGEREEGLIFICFQQDLERGFATVQRRLSGQSLDKYILPFGGGYFFVLPGSAGRPDDYPGKVLLDAVGA
jgi:deferrochelatase/peroxidase EfeB